MVKKHKGVNEPKMTSHQSDDQSTVKSILPRPISRERLLRIINLTTSQDE